MNVKAIHIIAIVIGAIGALLPHLATGLPAGAANAGPWLLWCGTLLVGIGGIVALVADSIAKVAKVPPGITSSLFVWVFGLLVVVPFCFGVLAAATREGGESARQDERIRVALVAEPIGLTGCSGAQVTGDFNAIVAESNCILVHAIAGETWQQVLVDCVGTTLEQIVQVVANYLSQIPSPEAGTSASVDVDRLRGFLASAKAALEGGAR